MKRLLHLMEHIQELKLVKEEHNIITGLQRRTDELEQKHEGNDHKQTAGSVPNIMEPEMRGTVDKKQFSFITGAR